MAVVGDFNAGIRRSRRRISLSRPDASNDVGHAKVGCSTRLAAQPDSVPSDASIAPTDLGIAQHAPSPSPSRLAFAVTKPDADIVSRNVGELPSFAGDPPACLEECIALVAQLKRALVTRDVIGQAKGILMAHQGLSADAAFDALRRASQRTNVKLHEVASRVVDEFLAGLNDDAADDPQADS